MAQVSGREQRRAFSLGCLAALGSAVLTGALLFINGAIVMALLAAAHGVAPPWLQRPQISQFLLFSLPVVLALIQWKAIDFVRTRIRRRTRESE